MSAAEGPVSPVVREGKIPPNAIKAAWLASLRNDASSLDIVRILEAAAPFMQAKRQSFTTAEELDTLPVGAVVLSGAYLLHANGQHIAFQRWEGGDWHRGGRSGSTHPDYIVPATVLHDPRHAG